MSFASQRQCDDLQQKILACRNKSHASRGFGTRHRPMETCRNVPTRIVMHADLSTNPNSGVKDGTRAISWFPVDLETTLATLSMRLRLWRTCGPAISARLTLHDQRVLEDVHDDCDWLLAARTNESCLVNVRYVVQMQITGRSRLL